MTKTIRLCIIVMIFSVSAFLTGCAGKVNNYSSALYDNGSLKYVNCGKNTSEKSVYEFGSVGKTVAAYTALSMIDEGILNLDMKIRPYLDVGLVTDDARLGDITLRQLLCHTSGFSPNYELGIDKKIYFDPGTKFSYSGVGYIYLQNVIENAGGMTFEQAVRHYVFEPLGMNDSTFISARTVTPYLKLSSAVLYSIILFIVAFAVIFLIGFVWGKLTKNSFFSCRTGYLAAFIAAGIINSVFLLFFFVSKVFFLFLAGFAVTAATLFLTWKRKKLFYFCVPVAMALFLAAGFLIPVSVPVTNDLIQRDANCAYSLKSTTEDMSRFCSELLKRSRDPEDCIYEMFVPAVEIDNRNAWGLGMAIEYSGKEETTYWHSGINPGFQSLIVLYPDDNKYIVTTTNSDDGLELAKNKAREFLGIDGVWEIIR